MRKEIGKWTEREGMVEEKMNYNLHWEGVSEIRVEKGKIHIRHICSILRGETNQ